MHRRKTGALIRASVRARRHRRRPGARERLRRRSSALALKSAWRFRSRTTSSTSRRYRVLGKRQGADAALGKPTYPSVFGLEAARGALRCSIATRRWRRSRTWAPRPLHLRQLAHYVVDRALEATWARLPVLKRGRSRDRLQLQRGPRTRGACKLTPTMSQNPLLSSAGCHRVPGRPARPRRARPAGARGELREFLIQTVSTRGGHFAAGLGTVELTDRPALRLSTRPHDRLVWDVGHQAYPHKVLTGRRDRLHTIKQTRRPRAVPDARRERIRHLRRRPFQHLDQRGARAWRSRPRARGEQRRAVAVIGDGAMTAGMAFEALNHAGTPADRPARRAQRQRHVDLRERRRAVELPRARALGHAVRAPARGRQEGAAADAARCCELARRSEEHVKGMVLPGTLFEEMGFNYIGPIDGHDVDALVRDAAQPARAAAARSSCTW